MVENQSHATTDEIKCGWCEKKLYLEPETKRIAKITIEREFDGAPIHTVIWAHEDCLPDDLAY